jgi:CheY-like chemotaxis protein
VGRRAGEETRILIVDDDPDIAKAFKIILEFQAYSVTVVTDGKECLEEVKNHRVAPHLTVVRCTIEQRALSWHLRGDLAALVASIGAEAHGTTAVLRQSTGDR